MSASNDTPKPLPGDLWTLPDGTLVTVEGVESWVTFRLAGDTCAAPMMVPEREFGGTITHREPLL